MSETCRVSCHHQVFSRGERGVVWNIEIDSTIEGPAAEIDLCRTAVAELHELELRVFLDRMVVDVADHHVVFDRLCVGASESRIRGWLHIHAPVRDTCLTEPEDRRVGGVRTERRSVENAVAGLIVKRHVDAVDHRRRERKVESHRAVLEGQPLSRLNDGVGRDLRLRRILPVVAQVES